MTVISQSRENADLGRRSMEVFQEAVRKNFAFLKRTTRLDDLWSKCIPLKDDSGYLIPVCDLHASDPDLIARLAQWRNENADSFPSKFPVTLDGTSSWLRSHLLDVEDRLLFLVTDSRGMPIGHLGYANAVNDRGELEIDNVVRGVKNVHPGIMRKAMQALLDWAEEVIGPARISLRVFQDNAPAVGFYRKLGFHDEELIPMRRHTEGASIYFRPLAEGDLNPPDRSFLRMVYASPDTFDGGELILTAGPSISARETSYALDAARHGWNHQWNKYIRRFETAFADYLGVKYALTTSSCTGALHIALAALGIGPGDEVIVPDLTWVATANAVLYVGAKPVFADVDPEYWCLDPASFESLITPKTKAVMPVDLYGHPAPMDRIMEIARKHHLLVVEDAAPSLGAECHGQKVGTFGNVAAFSFQGAKLTVTGEGGMLVTDDEELYRKLYTIWDQGRVPGTFWIAHNGLKYKMSNLQAAIGLGQLERIEELVEAKRRIYSWYAEGLSGTPHIRLNREAPWARSICWMTSILVEPDAPLTRDRLREELKKKNVDTRSCFPAISQYPIWPDKPTTPPVAKFTGDQVINLPSGVRLKRMHVDYICRCLREILG